MTTYRFSAAHLAWLVFATFSSAIIASETSDATAPAPPLAAACHACHGANGVSAAADVPNLAAQKRAYLATQLHAFRSGARPHELMGAIARQLTDADIAALSTWWSVQPFPATAAAAAAPASLMRFPSGFPQGFVHYDTINIPDDESVNLLYANQTALDQVRAHGRPGPGAVLIVASHRVRRDADGKPIADADGHWLPDALQSYSGMEARAGWGAQLPTLLRNGDWHYGLFGVDGEPRVGALHARCLACHQPRDADGFVFTIEALRRKASAR
jgi:cytochrome c553